MQPAFERTPRGNWESLHCEVVRGSSYNATWHYHPEVQITLALESHGYRLVGDKISPLHPGDLVLVGANLPHVWHQEKLDNAAGRVHAIVVRFLEAFLGGEFWRIPEARPIQRLLERSKRGLEVTGRTRELVTRQIRQFPELSGMDRIAALLTILATLARSRDLRPIATPNYAPLGPTGDQERVERVIEYIHRRVHGLIQREELAKEANLSVSAFSRFFKLRTGKTLPEYVNELRIGHACRLLSNESVKITEVALSSGFANLANFNRRFREITRLTPREYRARLRENAT